jgi:hypothetical protein
MVALDRRILDTPMEERAFHHLVAWTKFMLPVIHPSIR